MFVIVKKNCFFLPSQTTNNAEIYPNVDLPLDVIIPKGLAK